MALFNYAHDRHTHTSRLTMQESLELPARVVQAFGVILDEALAMRNSKDT